MDLSAATLEVLTLPPAEAQTRWTAERPRFDQLVINLRAAAPAQSPATPAAAASAPELDFDIGLQSRAFGQAGAAGQSRFNPSLSARLDVFQAWRGGRTTFRLQPFVRYDGTDSERTHADLRDAYVTVIGDSWDFHAGVRRVTKQLRYGARDL